MSQATGPGAQIRGALDEPPGQSKAATPTGADQPAPTRLGACDPRLSALSATVATLARDYGRSPAGATSWRLGENCVVTALEDFMTTAEQELVEKGAARLVRQTRFAFAEVVGDEYTLAAESALGREVIAHRSELICASNICLEIFLLMNKAGCPRASASDQNVSDPQHRPG